MRPILKKIKSIKFKWIVAAFLALYCVIIILNITNKGDFFQWDFRGFYYCAKSASSGLDPYNTKKIACAFNSYIFPYCYTPFSLYFFKLFTFFRYTAAFYIFLFLKCVLLLALIIIWRDGFFGRRLGVSFFVLCLLGFDRAIYLDFAAGNVSIFEQIFLWLAFLFYLRKRLFLFCVFILLASVFKLQPIFFLVLLFLCE
ncbi:MAG: glycosyltransferase 87 family protein [Candidatus Omnitrophica bacterium]|nr:glycosyltransferase 87 family protein [Candidatus Omnitrophota bacterium]